MMLICSLHGDGDVEGGRARAREGAGRVIGDEGLANDRLAMACVGGRSGSLREGGEVARRTCTYGLGRPILDVRVRRAKTNNGSWKTSRRLRASLAVRGMADAADSHPADSRSSAERSSGQPPVGVVVRGVFAVSNVPRG